MFPFDAFNSFPLFEKTALQAFGAFCGVVPLFVLFSAFEASTKEFSGISATLLWSLLEATFTKLFPRTGLILLFANFEVVLNIKIAANSRR